MKIVRENINEDHVTNESINETLQLNGYTYKIVKYNGKSIYASQEGILGYNNILIPWLILDKIKEKL